MKFDQSRRACCCEGFAWAHLANALRSLGDLAEAEEGFKRAADLWLEGALSHPGPLDNTRRRFAEDFRRTGGDPNLRPEPWPVLE